MIVRGVDTANDWLYGKGKNDYKSGVDAVAQNIKTRLQCFLGDCFFDEIAGIDWFNRLGSKDQELLKLEISSVILNTADVTTLIELSTSVSDNRNIIIRYRVNTVYGSITGSITQGA